MPVGQALVEIESVHSNLHKGTDWKDEFDEVTFFDAGTFGHFILTKGSDRKIYWRRHGVEGWRKPPQLSTVPACVFESYELSGIPRKKISII